jgi:hypothetical protein
MNLLFLNSIAIYFFLLATLRTNLHIQFFQGHSFMIVTGKIRRRFVFGLTLYFIFHPQKHIKLLDIFTVCGRQVT